ncbi:hypothetical protein QBC46DRAFT_386124 [Diplogelasinospora grovesii]|uniref:Uncharacterized protein n=1 Tax=Diplogelasinospora grovesii TaxID=303347 RepID=A0AAN6S4G1_9PEZI|nr:hypothetical protein QBC46DRAFT_386124 [Diplogelasinospora grovesii]
MADAVQDGAQEVVKWQTAWWALAPLAIGAITQPCGKIMGRPADHSVWLRISPIFCVADMAMFLISVVVSSLRDPRSSWRFFWKHCLFEIAARFEDDETGITRTREDEPPETLNKSAIRCALVVLGGIPCQTIKLLAAKGIPWTQTWALMFTISIVFGEIVWFFRPRSNPALQQLRTQMPPFWALASRGPSSYRPPALQFAIETLEWISRIMPSFLLIYSSLPIIGLTVWGSLWGYISDDGPLTIYSIILTMYPFLFQFIHCKGHAFTLAISSRPLSVDGLRNHDVQVGSEAPWVIGLIAPNLLFFWAEGPMMIILLSFVICLLYYVIFLAYIECSARFSMLLPIFWVVFLWLSTIVVSLLYYAFVYDPAGTVLPSWSGVFG